MILNQKTMLIRMTLISIGLCLGSLFTVILGYQASPIAPNVKKNAAISRLFRSPLKKISNANSFRVPMPLLSTKSDVAVRDNMELISGPLQEEGVGAWIPVGSIHALKGLGPQRVTIMNIDFVVWHSPEGIKKDNLPDRGNMSYNDKDKNQVIWTVQADACSHRLAPLSQGRVDPNTGCVECPYHGWQFDSQGNVTAVPQLDADRSVKDVQRSPRTNVKTFPTHVVGDLLFVFLPSSLHGEMFPQSLLPEEYYPFMDEERTLSTYVRELPYSFDFLVENFMDPAHIPFAHHKLQSTREDGSSIKMEVLESNFTHIQTSFKDISRARKRDGYASFQRPSLYHFSERKGELNEDTGERGGEWTPTLCMFLVPIAAGKCRLFINNNPALRKLPIPNWFLHIASNRFLNSDSWLHDAEREVIRRKESMPEVAKKLYGMDYQYQSKSDVGVTAFRKWWKDYGMADSPPHTFGMATMEQLGQKCLSRKEQIDPWEHHARQCSHCRKALINMKRLQIASVALSFLSAIFGQRSPVLAAIGVAVGLAGKTFFKKFATTIEGNPEISGIADRSSAASAQ